MLNINKSQLTTVVCSDLLPKFILEKTSSQCKHFVENRMSGLYFRPFSNDQDKLPNMDQSMSKNLFGSVNNEIQV